MGDLMWLSVSAWARWLSGVGAALLAACLLLPLSTFYGSPQYVRSEVEVDPLTWLWVLPFACPLAALAVGRTVSADLRQRVSLWCEPFGFLGALYVIGVFVARGRPAWGAFSGLIGVATSGAGWVLRAHSRRRRRVAA